MTAHDLISCFHCKRIGHWIADCPLLKMPADKDHHEARIATIRRWFTEQQIGPLLKAELINKELALWKARQKETK